jgi:hypothetical protein
MLVPGRSAYPDGQERLFIDEINQQPDLNRETNGEIRNQRFAFLLICCELFVFALRNGYDFLATYFYPEQS